ncbi:MAG: 3-deoxy-D-manno-octulosonic acid transferase [Syntrophaceae bacterium]|nr:3-deoxy-D-manno-octulosonic acid transferase [Syntrophaceae bacterium]
MPWSGLYNALLFIAALCAVPWYGAKLLLAGKYRRSLGGKFGHITPENEGRLRAPGRPRIWLHAVSVGEVTAAAPIVAALRTRFPEARLYLSTSTETGQEMAKQLVTAASAHFYYPLDIPAIVAKILDRVRPEVFVPVETELWPNFLKCCGAQRVRVALVNGRISPRSFRHYRLTRFFWKGVLSLVDRAAVISRTDAERLCALGMPAGRIAVMGNAKYDGLAARVSPALTLEIAARLGIAPGEGVLVAGSTHEGEETVVLEVYKRILEQKPDFKLILIPRHIERGDTVAGLIRRAGFTDCLRMSEINVGRRRQGERVVLIDLIGELFKVYSLATVVFCGGSLVPKGGQNLLEPAAWGKVVFHGPHMEDFLEETALLAEAGGGITVSDGEGLYRGILELLDAPDLLRSRGEAGRQAVAANRGAADRYAALIADLLQEDPPPI